MNFTSYKQFACLSGLPRAGSTLLTAILCQNPKIHAEGNSALSTIMWSTLQGYNECCEQLNANNKVETMNEIIRAIPHIYYKNIKEEIVIDKCRTWLLPLNHALLNTYITNDYKVLFLERSIVDVVKSFVKIYRTNGIYDAKREADLLIEHSNPLMKCVDSLEHAKKCALLEGGDKHFLFINYNDLIADPREAVRKIYAFFEWEPFEHDFDNIVQKYPENDDIYVIDGKNLNGLHKIRNSIGRQDNSTTVLSDELIAKCLEVDKRLGYI